MADKFQDKIVIKFKPEGEKGLIRAIQTLDRATKSLTNTQFSLITSGKKANKNILDLGHSARQTGGAFSVLRSKLLLVNFALGLGIRQISKLVEESAKVQSMETAFNTLSGATENSSIALIKLKEATNGTMNEFDLFQQANNAMILGVSKNSDEMAEMFDIAQRLGRALGRDTASSVESLITGIGRQSRLMLDNIGIIVKTEEAYKSYAKKLKITTDELSDSQKKQAFLSATMESAREKVQTLGVENFTTKDTFDQLTASASNLSKELGVTLSPLFNKLAKDSTTSVNRFTDLLQIMNHTKGAELQFVEATEKAREVVRRLSRANNVTIRTMAPLSAQILKVQKNVELMGDDYRELRVALNNLNRTQKAYNSTLKDTTAQEAARKAAKEKTDAEKARIKAIEDALIAEQKAFLESANTAAKRNFLEEEKLKKMKKAEKERIKARKETLKALTKLEEDYQARQKEVQDSADAQRKAIQDRRQQENEQFLENINSSLNGLNSFLSAWKTNMNARMDTEMSTLKDSEKYKQADSERRKDMEREITKGYQEEQMKQFRIGQATAIADIGMSTSSALMKSVAGSWVTIGQPWFGIISALGLLQAGAVMSQKPPSFEQGGLIGGRRHSQGGTMIEAERGEFVMSRDAVKTIGLENLNNMNQGGGGGITLNISAPLVDETVLDTIIPAIQKAQRMNLA